MRARLLIHPYYDKDLYVLMKSPYLNFHKFVKDAIIAYAKGLSYNISPQPFEVDIDDCFDAEDIKTAEFFEIWITISDTKYPEVAEMMERVKKNQKTLLIKSILRTALVGDIAYVFFDNNWKKQSKPHTKIIKEKKSPVLKTETAFESEKADSSIKEPDVQIKAEPETYETVEEGPVKQESVNQNQLSKEDELEAFGILDNLSQSNK